MRHIYLREPLAGNSDFGIGQVYSQEVIKQMHVSTVLLSTASPLTLTWFHYLSLRSQRQSRF